MNTKLVAAMACVVALALGACAGGAPAPTTPTTPGEPTDPGTDARTDAQKTFDDALTAAQATLATARAGVDSAVELARAADTAAKRTAATTALTNARTALTNAVNAIKNLAVPSGDANRRGRKEAAATAADTALTADTAKLTAGEAAIRTSANAGTWFGRTAYIPRADNRAEVKAATVVRRNRNTGNTPDADHADLLDDDSFPVVQYAAGKYLIAEGQATGGEWLRMRGFDVGKKDREAGYERHPDGQGIQVGQATSSTLVAGLKLTSSGLMVQLGGHGAGGADLVKKFDGTAAQRLETRLAAGTPDAVGWDLTLTFGAPQPAPDGNGEFYWTSPLYDDESQRDYVTRLVVGTAGTQSPLEEHANQLGTYQVWLSNFVEADYGLEPTQGGSNPDDDEYRFLKYAAYGMMTFATNRNIDNRMSGRVHAFYVGYDAFKDEAGKQPDDISDANKLTAAKFVGRTIARTTPGEYTSVNNLIIDVAGAKRLRGDVELTVTITDAAQTISGHVDGLQWYDGTTGRWTTYTNVASRVAFAEATIGDDGTFSARADARNAANSGYDEGFRQGHYWGAFLGPHDDLEAAGWWMVPSGDGDGGNTATKNEGILGSFGAKQEPASSDDE